MFSNQFSFSDVHQTAPFVATGSVDLFVKVWECRWSSCGCSLLYRKEFIVAVHYLTCCLPIFFY